MNKIKTGKELHEFLSYNFLTKTIGWQIPRSNSRNDNFKITGVVISANVDNKAIGTALQKSANVILSLNYFCVDTNLDLIELIYKNEIFIYSIGVDWIFNTKLGHKILMLIFSGSNANVWIENNNHNHCFLTIPKYITFETILNRFKDVIIWTKCDMDNFKNCKLNNILIFEDNVDKSIVKKLNSDVVISTLISSDIINYVLDKNSSLIWMHNDMLLNEVCRELMFYLGQKSIIKNLYLSLKKTIKIYNGLNGI